MKTKSLLLIQFLLALIFTACTTSQKPGDEISKMQKKVDEFAPVELNSDLMNNLSENQKKMLSCFFEIANVIDDLYWLQAYGNKAALFALTEDEAEKEFFQINYGPWERLKGNEPFVDGFDTKPPGAQFYPSDMSKEEFKAFESEDKSSLYTVIRRNDEAKLKSVPYHSVSLTDAPTFKVTP